MATKKTTTKKTAPKAVAKAPAKAPKAEKKTVSTAARHPRARVVAKHGDKATLAKSLAASVARTGEDTEQLATKLATASNAQLLRLQAVAATVKDKYGSRDKLIAAIGTANNKSKDKDFLAKLEKFSLPQLLDLAKSSERRARA